MINQYKEITSQNPFERTWKLLRFFKDVHSMENPVTDDSLTNTQQIEVTNKLAKQTGYCLKRAEEYFSAASATGLSTKPVMIYDAVIALTEALILVRKGGESLNLRKIKKDYLHPGLEIIGDLSDIFEPGLSLQAALSAIVCKCSLQNDAPHGLFALYYSALTPPAFAVAKRVHDDQRQTSYARMVPVSTRHHKKIDNIAYREISVMSLIRALPDMFESLSDFGIEPDLARGETSCIAARPGAGHSDKAVITKLMETHDFYIHGLTPEQKGRLLSFYSDANPDIVTRADFDENLHLTVTKPSEGDESLRWYYPDIVDDINSNKYFILEPENYISEPASMYIIVYSLYIFARHYPDVWVRAVEDNVYFAEVMDTLLNIIIRKFPVLVLDQMAETKHNIHV